MLDAMVDVWVYRKSSSEVLMAQSQGLIKVVVNYDFMRLWSLAVVVVVVVVERDARQAP